MTNCSLHKSKSEYVFSRGNIDKYCDEVSQSLGGNPSPEPLNVITDLLCMQRKLGT